MLDGLDMCYPDTQAQRCVNVKQMNSSVGQRVVPTVTPTCTIWLGHRGRLLRGAEALAVQGIYVPRQVSRQFGNALLLDLGGNSFSTPCFSACLISALSGLALMWEDAWHFRFAKLCTTSAPPAPLPKAEVLNDDADADDAVNWCAPRKRRSSRSRSASSLSSGARWIKPRRRRTP